MCTQTEEITTTNSPRPLATLLSLNTYQDMTDEEIELIIDYKIQREKYSQESLLKHEIEIVEMEQRLEDNRLHCSYVQDMVKLMLKRTNTIAPTPEMVIFEPRSMEL